MTDISRIDKKLKIKDFKLKSLLEVTKAINNNLSKNKLFEMLGYILKDELGIGKIILFECENSRWKCSFKQGARSSVRQFEIEKDLLHIREITLIKSSTKKHLNTFDVVIPVYHKSQPLAYLLLGDLNENAKNISPIIRHMSFIQTLANIIMVAVENKRMAKESIKQERMKRELELASEMQTMLFPSELPDDEHFQMSAYYLPHHNVGGDYYDYIKLNNEEIIFCLADVSGKGIPAALLAANFQANLRALASLQSKLPLLVTDLNAKVMASAKGERFITMFIAKYNLKTRVLHYINAGHNPPLLKQGDHIIALSEGSTGLGMFDKLPFITEGSKQILKNDIFLGFTDGVVEEENTRGQAFGSEQLEAMLCAHDTLTMSELNQMIITAVDSHRGQQPYLDDIAIFSCRFK